MPEKSPKDGHETNRRITTRQQVMLGLGVVLIALGFFVDWPPPQEAGLPDTSSFLIIVGGLLGAAGLLAGLQRE
jgi:hypothetical protein